MGVMKDVQTLAFKKRDVWRDAREYLWLHGLLDEVQELTCALQEDHEHPPDIELLQIASIAVNWLQLRRDKGIACPPEVIEEYINNISDVT